jgi:hypothetical protein
LVIAKRPFFAEKWHKSQKIVIITSTPGHTVVDNVDQEAAAGLVAVVTRHQKLAEDASAGKTVKNDRGFEFRGIGFETYRYILHTKQSFQQD